MNLADGQSAVAGGPVDTETRLAIIVETMREISRQTDPQAMVRLYGNRIRSLLPIDRTISLSRRDLQSPQFRVTRYSEWKEAINPWKERHRLPLLEGGLLAELIYADKPSLIDDLIVPDDDPAAEYLAGHRSLAAVPQYDQGVALNMVIALREEPGAFLPEQLPEMVWTTNLFGRATHNLVLADQLQTAYDAVDRELRAVAEIQRTLLPAELPKIPRMELAAHYQSSRRAGGDYYDFFPLPDGRWGILIADVSGHGTPAAVMMAITHTIAHGFPGPPMPAPNMLEFLNQRLTCRYLGDLETFVTAFYGIFDPAKGQLTYASAGHNPPLLKRCGEQRVSSLDEAQQLPLGIYPDQKYLEGILQLQAGDRVLFYTDGITEAEDPSGTLFGQRRLEQVMESCCDNPEQLIQRVLTAVDSFSAGQPLRDDRTLVVATVG
jgi:phosphoserine phosphatase RsbU/P